MMKPTDRSGRHATGGKPALGLLLVIVVAVVAGGTAYVRALGSVDPNGNSVKSLVQIENGAGLTEITELLASRNCLRSPVAFKLHALITGRANKLKSGIYQVSTAMSAPDIVQMLVEGRQATATVTVPEGFTIAQIAGRLAEAGLVDENQFRAAATAQAVEEALQIKLPTGARTAEGYLFPETYNFALSTTADQIVARMAEEFATQFAKGPWQAMPTEARWGSLHEVVTMASLVEEEAQQESERALIAGVLRNRLVRGMRLECDATVLYALGEHRARLTNKDLQIDSPYNTYRHMGLPPGPISNPGLACLSAALEPAQTEYLFYVARGDGSHIFSRTYQEHKAAIRKVRDKAER